MIDDKIEDIYQQTLTLYGESHQLVKLTEECGELVQALCKYINKKSDKNKNSVTEEIVDVEILVQQIKLSLKNNHQYEVIKQNKLIRQKQRNIEEKNRIICNKPGTEPYEFVH